MGSSCSSGQAHKDKDSQSQGSEESPSYEATSKPADSCELKPVQPIASSPTVPSPAVAPSTSGAPKHTASSSLSSGVVLRVEKTAVPVKPAAVQQHRTAALSTLSADSASPGSPPGVGVLSPIEIDKSSLPASIRKLPDDTQHLLLGSVSAAKSFAKAKKIVIYVSAADSQDCCVEKGLLHNKVYPKLRQESLEYGYELHIVDLHWRTALEKQQDHEFPELCVEQLNRQSEVSYTIPVLFLSDSLGTPLLPKTIEAQDFEMVLKSSLTNIGDKKHLEKWYRLDSDAQPPCYRLQSSAALIPGLKESRNQDREKALAAWQIEMDQVLTVLLAAFSDELRDSYLTTVVEQEVHNTVIMSQELAKRCLWLNRIYTHQPQDDNNKSTPSEAELKRRLDTLQKGLKNLLDERHVLRIPVQWSGNGLDVKATEHAQYAADVTAQLESTLSAIIKRIVEDEQNKALPSPLMSVSVSQYGVEAELICELSRQAQFVQRAARCSVNGEGVMSQLKSYMTGETANKKVFVLHGAQGSGKTTVVVRAAQCCHLWLNGCSSGGNDALLAARFVGVTPQSLTMEQVLRTVLAQCEIVASGQALTHKHNIETYAQVFLSTLTATSLQRTVIVILDGLDQVQEYGSDSYDWLPTSLPANVRLILTANDDVEGNNFEKIRSRLGSTGAHYVKMPVLNEQEAKSILMSAVVEYNHSVNSTIQDCVKASVAECTLPLYIKVLAWHTSWICPGAENEVSPRGNVENQIMLMLEQLESLLGSEQVALAMTLLVSAKYGLTDSEMLDLLAHEPAFHSDSTYLNWAPACLFWARFVKRMAAFLVWLPAGGTNVVHWRDSTLRSIVKRKYANRIAWAHNTLADYFKGELWSKSEDKFEARFIEQTNSIGKGRYNCRRLEELPYQCCKQNCKNFVRDYLFDHKWVFDKLCGSSVYQVLEDISLVPLDCAISNDISWLRSFLETFSSALGHDGRQFYTLLGAPNVPKNPASQLCVAWSQMALDPPITCLAILASSKVGDDTEKTSNNETEPAGSTPNNERFFDNIYRLPKNPDFVVTISADREEICVWDIHKCMRVRTLRKVTQPITLEMIDDYRCVVLCKRELRTYDLNTGNLLTKLKGVMNQKMPYYGLHDPSHLVALSRNRMYVNLMNLDTGDLVTTFKAGEDRFLNSLLVSGDGRVLVCGDETQKPFPLLVWNLASRKLLYDLRIPHHDFLTNLAAITYEGHYVCCVTKEVDEPAPNFIVVYDLQSGTLFKKWKSGVNCVSLDISSKDGCVLSGHEDGRILLWDLVTGNCRCKLIGHSGPVSCLRLDPKGGAFLSYDVECRDRSMRLWNITTGEQSAVFTPDRLITACEIAAGGQFVVIATEGSNQLMTLQLVGPGRSRIDADTRKNQVESAYNVAEKIGKVFDLEDR